jgi:hypothetical protein
MERSSFVRFAGLNTSSFVRFAFRPARGASSSGIAPRVHGGSSDAAGLDRGARRGTRAMAGSDSSRPRRSSARGRATSAAPSSASVCAPPAERRDAACPPSTRGGTRLVRLVRGRGVLQTWRRGTGGGGRRRRGGGGGTRACASKRGAPRARAASPSAEARLFGRLHPALTAAEEGRDLAARGALGALGGDFGDFAVRGRRRRGPGEPGPHRGRRGGGRRRGVDARGVAGPRGAYDAARRAGAGRGRGAACLAAGARPDRRCARLAHHHRDGACRARRRADAAAVLHRVPPPPTPPFALVLSGHAASLTPY